jgi:hypothetical protein
MFQRIVNAVCDHGLTAFLFGPEALPEFRNPVPKVTNRKSADQGLRKYEDRLSVFIGNLIGAVNCQVRLTPQNTTPSISKGVTPDITKYSANQDPNLLQHNGVCVENYVEFGHNYITQPAHFPANKFLMDFAKIMKMLDHVKRGGNFYHVMAITDPISVATASTHLLPRTYGIINYLQVRNNRVVGRAHSVTRIVEIYEEYKNIMPNSKVALVSIPAAKGYYAYITHFIICGPFTKIDTFDIWQNAKQSPVFSNYEIVKNPERAELKNYFEQFKN